ncbi:MAG TPA: hypothetical protein VFG00_12660 [Acidothermaceae bacterium]|nr:hypothetical protein [Acidothermaceae bacterium]
MKIRSLFNLRRDLVIAIAVPVAGKLMSVAAQQLRERRGPNQFADRLDQGSQLIRRVSRLV